MKMEELYKIFINNLNNQFKITPMKNLILVLLTLLSLIIISCEKEDMIQSTHDIEGYWLEEDCPVDDINYFKGKTQLNSDSIQFPFRLGDEIIVTNFTGENKDSIEGKPHKVIFDGNPSGYFIIDLKYTEFNFSGGTVKSSDINDTATFDFFTTIGTTLNLIEPKHCKSFDFRNVKINYNVSSEFKGEYVKDGKEGKLEKLNNNFYLTPTYIILRGTDRYEIELLTENTLILKKDNNKIKFNKIK